MEPMNATPYHSKVRVSLAFSDRVYVAGSYVTGKMTLECKSDKELGIGEIKVELFGVQELTSRDHSATSTFLHITRFFQAASLPPSNAVHAHPLPGAPPLPAHYYPARKGLTSFFFRLPLPRTSPTSIDFGKGLARLRYTVRASVGVAYKGDRRQVTDNKDVGVLEAYDVLLSESGEKITIGENGKVWVRGRVLNQVLVAGESACVELYVKNHSSRTTSGLTLSMNRRLVLPSLASGVPPKDLQLSDTLMTVPFKGPDYIVHPGTEGVAHLVFTVPKSARGVKGGLREGYDGVEFEIPDDFEGNVEEERKKYLTECLFEVKVFMVVKISIAGVGVKDIILEVPVTVVGKESVPPGEAEADGYPLAMDPQAQRALSPGPPLMYNHTSYSPTPYSTPPQMHTPRPPDAWHPPTHVHPQPQQQYWTPPAHPLGLGYVSPPPPDFPHPHSPAVGLDQQLYFPPPTPLQYLPQQNLWWWQNQANGTPPRPSSADPYAAQQPRLLLPGQQQGHVHVPSPPTNQLPITEKLQANEHQYSIQSHQQNEIYANLPRSHVGADQHHKPEHKAQDPMSGEVGKGERASRITAHLRYRSRHRSVSPLSHRFPLPSGVPPPHQHQPLDQPGQPLAGQHAQHLDLPNQHSHHTQDGTLSPLLSLSPVSPNSPLQPPHLSTRHSNPSPALSASLSLPPDGAHARSTSAPAPIPVLSPRPIVSPKNSYRGEPFGFDGGGRDDDKSTGKSERVDVLERMVMEEEILREQERVQREVDLKRTKGKEKERGEAMEKRLPTTPTMSRHDHMVTNETIPGAWPVDAPVSQGPQRRLVDEVIDFDLPSRHLPARADSSTQVADTPYPPEVEKTPTLPPQPRISPVSPSKTRSATTGADQSLLPVPDGFSGSQDTSNIATDGGGLSGLELLEKRLAEQVGTRKVSGPPSQQRSAGDIMQHWRDEEYTRTPAQPHDQLSNTTPTKATVRSNRRYSELTIDTAISSLLLGDVANNGAEPDDEGLEKGHVTPQPEPHLQARLPDRVALDVPTKPRPNGGHSSDFNRGRKDSQPQPQNRKQNQVKQMRKAATGRVAAWLGGIDPSIPPPTVNSPPASVSPSPRAALLDIGEAGGKGKTEEEEFPEYKEDQPHPLLRHTKFRTREEVLEDIRRRESGSVGDRAKDATVSTPSPVLSGQMVAANVEPETHRDPTPTSPPATHGSIIIPKRSSGFVLHATIKGPTTFEEKDGLIVELGANPWASNVGKAGDEAGSIVQADPEPSKPTDKSATSPTEPQPSFPFLPRARSGKPIPAFSQHLPRLDPEVKYDIRSARGGKGGIVASVAALWANMSEKDGESVSAGASARVGPGPGTKVGVSVVSPNVNRPKKLSSMAPIPEAPASGGVTKTKNPPKPAPKPAPLKSQTSLPLAATSPTPASNSGQTASSPITSPLARFSSAATPVTLKPTQPRQFQLNPTRRPTRLTPTTPTSSSSANTPLAIKRTPPSTTSASPTLGTSFPTRTNAGVKSLSVPAVLSSKLATPMISSTASLARPLGSGPTTELTEVKSALGTFKPITAGAANRLQTVTQSRSAPAPVLAPTSAPAEGRGEEMAFGQARLKELIKKYQR